MIFSVQRYIEDYFERRHLSDVDQYAVKLANAYTGSPTHTSDKELLMAFHRVRTVFFQNNPHLKRNQFESTLLQLLRSRFKKKVQLERFPGGLTAERRKLLRLPRVTIESIIRGFGQAVEGRAILSGHPKPAIKGHFKTGQR